MAVGVCASLSLWPFVWSDDTLASPRLTKEISRLPPEIHPIIDRDRHNISDTKPHGEYDHRHEHRHTACLLFRVAWKHRPTHLCHPIKFPGHVADIRSHVPLGRGIGMARGRRTSLTIHLTVEERRTLLAWQRSTTIPAGQARRSRILLLLKWLQLFGWTDATRRGSGVRQERLTSVVRSEKW